MVSEVKPDRAALLRELAAKHVADHERREARKREAEREAEREAAVASAPPPLTDYQRRKERTKYRAQAERHRAEAEAAANPAEREHAMSLALSCDREVERHTKQRASSSSWPPSRNRRRGYRNQRNMLDRQ